MSEEISIDHDNHRYVGKCPNTCPICHKSIYLEEEVENTIIENQLQVVYSCPSCSNYFIAIYDVVAGSSRNQLKLTALRPTIPEPAKISDEIKNISPLFVEIYNQALHAQKLGLKQICGPGFRKAFEFLIKDYAKTQAKSEDEKKKIESEFSGTVVKKYIGDARIQAVASRALWLGNDETHYLRRWDDKNIDDLCALILLTIHWIEISVLSAKYIEEMPNPA